MPIEHGLIKLNNLDFQDFAIPEFVKSSGPYRWIVHKQPGGARQLDGMGDDPEPYTWTGLFLQNDATDKMVLLQEMKLAGKPVQLQYGRVNDLVVIEDVTFNYMAPMRIEYSIKCIPVTNGDNGPAAANPPQLPPPL